MIKACLYCRSSPSKSSMINYLRERAIDEDLAHRYCKDVTFEIASKQYHAIGFPNRSGGYELRNNWFKGSSSPKDITFIDNDSSKLNVIEGFMDFLSIEQLKSRTPPLGNEANVLILNSLSFLNRNHSLIKSHESFLFLDNDEAGKKAKDNLHKSNISFMDCSGFYSQHKDVNEYLVAHSPYNEEQVRKNVIRL